MGKRYKLIKDLPTFSAGQEFYIGKEGALWLDTGTGRDICAYAAQTLQKFPNVLRDWFEEIPEKPKTVDNLKFGDEVWLAVIVEEGDSRKPAIIPVKYVWHDSDQQRILRELGEVFLTKKDCEKSIAWNRAKTILERDAKGFKPKKNSGTFWAIGYDVQTEELILIDKDSGYLAAYMFSDIVFETKEDAQRSGLDHSDEWKTYLGVEE